MDKLVGSLQDKCPFDKGSASTLMHISFLIPFPLAVLNMAVKSNEVLIIESYENEERKPSF